MTKSELKEEINIYIDSIEKYENFKKKLNEALIDFINDSPEELYPYIKNFLNNIELDIPKINMNIYFDQCFLPIGIDPNDIKLTLNGKEINFIEATIEH